MNFIPSDVGVTESLNQTTSLSVGKNNREIGSTKLSPKHEKQLLALMIEEMIIRNTFSKEPEWKDFNNSFHFKTRYLKKIPENKK